MTTFRSVLFAAALGSLTLSQGVPLSGQTTQTLIKARRVYTGATPWVIENGQILIEGRTIKAVGTRVAASPAARVYEVDTAIPGLIDTHAHVAVNPVPEPPAARLPANTAQIRTVDNFRFGDPVLRTIVEGGVTSLVTRGGGPGQVFKGQCLAIKLKDAPRDEVILREYVDLLSNVRTGVGGSVLTLSGYRATARREFVRAQEYMRRQEAHAAGGSAQPFVRDAQLEALAALLRREVPFHVHVNFQSEILMVLDLAREFNLRLTLAHANYGHRVAREIKEAGVIPVVGPTFIVQSYDEDTPQNVPALLAAAGVDVALQMDLGAQHNKSFLEIGSLLVRHGMREEDALRALTINGAKAILMEDRIGSIEAGKDADIALLDGAPFDLTTTVTHTFIDGKLEFELKEKPQTATLTPVGPFTPMAVRATPASAKIAIVNATVFPITSDVIRGGTVLVDNGTIAAVGAGLRVPAGYDVIDAGGRAVMPGMVAARAYPVNVWSPWWGSTAGADLADERVRPVTPDVDPRFNLDPFMPNWKIMRELGLTTYLITPGNTNVIGGKGVVVRGLGDSFEEMVRVPEPTAMVFSIAEGTARAWGASRFEGRGIVTLLKEALDRAKEYEARRAAGGRVPPNPRAEALVPVLQRRSLAIVNADTEREIRTAIQLADEYGLRIAISSGVEAHRVIDELKARDIPVILGNSGTGWSAFEDIRGRRDLAFDDRTPGRLARAGITVALFGPGGHRGNLPIGRLGGEPTLNAAWCFRNGMPEADALRMLTINGAEVAGVADRLGSLEPGKIADLVIVNGHPLTHRAMPDLVLIDGRIVYQRAAVSPGKTVTP